MAAGAMQWGSPVEKRVWLKVADDCDYNAFLHRYPSEQIQDFVTGYDFRNADLADLLVARCENPGAGERRRAVRSGDPRGPGLGQFLYFLTEDPRDGLFRCRILPPSRGQFPRRGDPRRGGAALPDRSARAGPAAVVGGLHRCQRRWLPGCRVARHIHRAEWRTSAHDAGLYAQGRRRDAFPAGADGEVGCPAQRERKIARLISLCSHGRGPCSCSGVPALPAAYNADQPAALKNKSIEPAQASRLPDRRLRREQRRRPLSQLPAWCRCSPTPSRRRNTGWSPEFYAYMGFFAVLLVFGLETGYFRFREDGDGRPRWSTHGAAFRRARQPAVSFCFSGCFASPWPSCCSHGDHPEYICLGGGHPCDGLGGLCGLRPAARGEQGDALRRHQGLWRSASTSV